MRCALFVTIDAFAIGSPTETRPPNLLLITVDTLRADHMGSYGYPRQTTPNIDAFFENTTVFEHAMTPAPCTVPAVRQLLTGRLDRRAEGTSLPELLAAAGYRTAAVVSQHQFRWEGLEHYQRGFDSFDIQADDHIDQHRMTARTAEEVSERALEWLEQSGHEEPFFLWLHYFDPHDPYEPPEAFLRFRSPAASGRDGDRRRDLMAAVDAGEPWQLAGSIFDAADVSRLVDLYDGEILYTDAEIGRLLSTLERSGIADRSVVAFFSDHGEWLGEGDRWDHCRTLRRPEIHVPLAITLNGKPLAGRPRVGEPVSLLDLAPTLTSAVGARTDPGLLDGLDLGRSEARRSGVFAAWRGRAALLDAGWKLLYDRGRVVGLFEGARDTDETQNRAGSENLVEGQLTQRIEDFFAAHPTLRSQNRETLERLRALGYAE